MTDRYERLLGAIAASLLGGAAASLHPAVTLHYGLAAGGLLATLFLYEALFRNPPVPPTDPHIASVVVFWHVALVWLLLSLL